MCIQTGKVNTIEPLKVAAKSGHWVSVSMGKGVYPMDFGELGCGKEENGQKPHSFEKATVPVDAENWISHIEKIFDVIGCEDAFKTRLAVYKFEGNALAWWKAYKQAKGGDAWSTLNHLMCMSYTDVAQVANVARNYEILHERDDQDTERPDKREVVIGTSRPLSRVVTGVTVRITTVTDLTGVVAMTTTAAATITTTTLAVTTG
nr:hypothetical protein [Tanacetum cinerariifolium]